MSLGSLQRARLSAMLSVALLVLAALLAPAHRVRAGQRLPAKEPDVEPPAPSPDWQRLGPPQPGDWLYAFQEPGQTFAEYKDLMGGPRPKDWNRIYVVPLGQIGKERPELLEKAVRYLGIFFDTEVERLPAQPLPRACYNARRGQYHAGELVRHVLLPLAGKQKDTLAMIGLTSVDLYHGNLNFVFGIGAYSDRLGLCSVCRFIPEGEDPRQLALKRTLKTAAHEIGHILGMAHCTFYNCVMNGSNSLRESDRRSLFLCPVCLRKLEWYVGFDSHKRYEKLREFFSDCGLTKDAAFCERRAAELKDAEDDNTEP